ncbi:MAG: hypothetical protein VKK43_09065 [Synechococcaceae cyanobacterium]|jgi:hypothetical protein|nr:hypothetical protein [Synechococcaceae cyanobacterium]
MYLLTIRDGLQTRHIGPYATPAEAADQLDQVLASCGERAHWQIHELEAPLSGACSAERPRPAASSADRSRGPRGVAAA